MATLADALKDRKSFPDTQEVVIGDMKITLGELRQLQESTGQDVAKQLEAERQRLADQQAEVAKAQNEVVELWTKLQATAGKQPAAPSTSADWTKDPFFAPIAEHLDKNVMAKVNELASNYAQVQKALALGVKYITDTFSEMRYQSLPEDFRKEISYEQAVKQAADKKFLDSGGVPDIRKVYSEWQTPRERKATEERIQKEAYDKAKADLMAQSLPRPSGLPVGAAPSADPNAPHNMKESFNKLKEDPEFLKQLYGLTGQA
jgi:hypothetical protein